MPGAWIASCDFTSAFYIYMWAWVYNELAGKVCGYILGRRLLTYRACYVVHQGLKSKRYYT